jgi:uncharacterized protein YkwD
MRAIFLVFVEAVALAVAGVPRPLLAAPQQYQQYQEDPQYGSDQPDLREAAEQIFALANQARAQAGVASLQWDPTLAAAALQHCRMMVAQGALSHRYVGEPDLSSRGAQAGAHFGLIEENVAMAPSASAVHMAWMQSPDHRRNLLSPEVDHVGIAVEFAHGELYAVADYSAALEILSPMQVEARAAALLRASGVSILPDPTLARSACSGDADPSRFPVARPAWMIRWQNSDLSNLPEPLLKQLALRKYRKAAIGSCPTQDSGSTFTSYRVAVLLY